MKLLQEKTAAHCLSCSPAPNCPRWGLTYSFSGAKLAVMSESANIPGLRATLSVPSDFTVTACIPQHAIYLCRIGLTGMAQRCTGPPLCGAWPQACRQPAHQSHFHQPAQTQKDLHVGYSTQQARVPQERTMHKRCVYDR